MSWLGDAASAVGGVVGDVVGGLSGGLAAKNNYHAEEYQVDPNAANIANKYGGQLNQSIAGAKNRATPNAKKTNINTAQSDQERAQQQQLIQALQARAAGQGTSPAQAQLQRGTDAAINAQRSAAASARGVNPGVAQKVAATNMANTQQQGNVDSAVLRANEQSQAQEALGGVLSGARGQDIGLATDQAGLNQNVNLANQQSELANRAQMDSAMENFMAQGMSREMAETQAKLQVQQMQAQAFESQQNANAGIASQNAANQQAVTGGLLAGGGAALASDIRAKTDIQPIGSVLPPPLPGVNDKPGSASIPIGDIKAGEAERARVAAELAKKITPAMRLGAGLSMLGQTMAVSDEDEKKNKDPHESSQIDSFLNKLKGYKYQYKDPSLGTGDQYGVMAQDLEKSDIGKTVVEDNPENGMKMVDTPKLTMVNTATLADMNSRLKLLEAMKDRKRARKAA